MAISDDWAIDYTAKTIRHTSGTTVYQMYELYAWIMTDIDESTTIDDTVPMTAQTPTAYTITNGWFIDYTSTQFLYNGSLQTSGWTDDIRMISYNASTVSFASADIGETITGATTGDTGTVLHYDERYGTDLGAAWIRMDDSGDLFDNATEDFLVSGGGSADGLFTVTFDSGGSLTGETVWANPFTLGTLVTDTKTYIVQDFSEITSWWSSGQIDILLSIKEAGVLIDEGYATILARQYSTLYDHYLADLSTGSRTPIPLAAFDDVNNETGYKQMVLTDSSGDYIVGEIITDNSDSTLQGVITSVTGTTPNNTIQYYLLNSLADFSASTGTFTGSANSYTATAVNSTTVGPAAIAGITIAFSSSANNLNNGNGTRPYDVTINCNSNDIEDVYEYLKYINRRGSTTTFSGSGHTETGDLYIATGEQYLTYGSLTNTFTQGNTVTGSTSGATAIIVSDHSSANLVITNILGTFESGESITEGTASATITAIENISASKQSPFGTFAGGKFFGARGVWLANVPAADANNYQLIDATGTAQIPPQTIAITISNTLNGDRVAVFKTTGDNEVIDKSQYTSHATNNSGSSTSYEVDAGTPILADTPDAGYIRLVNQGTNIEERIAFSSWTGNVFSLDSAHSGGYDGSDTAYVPYVDTQATGSSVSESIVYTADRYVLIRARNVGILPFKIKGQITTLGLPATVIRSSDSIYQ